MPKRLWQTATLVWAGQRVDPSRHLTGLAPLRARVGGKSRGMTGLQPHQSKVSVLQLRVRVWGTRSLGQNLTHSMSPPVSKCTDNTVDVLASQ